MKRKLFSIGVVLSTIFYVLPIHSNVVNQSQSDSFDEGSSNNPYSNSCISIRVHNKLPIYIELEIEGNEMIVYPYSYSDETVCLSANSHYHIYFYGLTMSQYEITFEGACAGSLSIESMFPNGFLFNVLTPTISSPEAQIAIEYNYSMF